VDRGSNRVRGWKVGVSKGKNDLVGRGIRTHAQKVQIVEVHQHEGP